MKSNLDSIEITAKTVEDAIQSGLSKLGCDITDVNIEVLEEGSKGFFGLFGAKLAKVRLTQRTDAFDDIDIESLLRPGASTRVSTVAPVKPVHRDSPQSAERDASTARTTPLQPTLAKQPTALKPDRQQSPTQPKPDRPQQSTAAPKPERTQTAAQPKPDRPQPAAQPKLDRPQSASTTAPERTPPARIDKAQPTPRTDRPERSPAAKPNQPRPPKAERPPRAPKLPRADADSPRALIPAGPLPDQDPATLPVESRTAYEYLARITQLMDVDVKIYAAQNSDNLCVSMLGDTLGILIGRRGETLDALQYLASLEVNKGREQYMRVTLDTENYRAKREDSLNRLAQRMAARARKTGRKVVLEPMNPYERRVLHATLQNDPFVQTHSEGDEPNRRVVITLRPGVMPETPAAAGSQSAPNARASRPPRPNEPRTNEPRANDGVRQSTPNTARNDARPPKPPRPPRRTYPRAQVDKKPLSSILGDDFEQCQTEFSLQEAAEHAKAQPQTIMQSIIELSDDETE